MLRALRPYLAVAAVIAAAAGTAYAFGAPVWVIYVGTLLGVFALLPGWERWDRQQHP
jgi:hypothetical protein